MGKTVIASAGELLVEFVAQDRNTRHRAATAYRGPFPSGAPGIFMDQAARLGVRTIFSGAVGADAFGDVLRRRLNEAGVDDRLIAIDKERPTGSAFVGYNEDGSRDFVFNIAHSAASRFASGAEAVDAFRAAGTSVFHVSGSSLGDARMREGLLALAQALHASGVAISIDPNVRRELLGDSAYFFAIETLLGLATYVLPSDDDAAALFPGEGFETFAPRLMGRGARFVVLKRGDRGCLALSHDGTRLDLPAHKVGVVDPTGAGDCFCATFVALVASGRFGFGDALVRANAAGALAVGALGPMEGNSSLERIERFLEASP